MPSSSSNFIITKTTRMYLYYYILISIFTMFIICIDNTNSVVHSSNSKMLPCIYLRCAAVGKLSTAAEPISCSKVLGATVGDVMQSKDICLGCNL